LTPASAALACPTIKQRRVIRDLASRKSVRIQGAMMTSSPKIPNSTGAAPPLPRDLLPALEKDGISLGKNTLRPVHPFSHH